MTNKEAIAFLSEFQEKRLFYGRAHQKAIYEALTLAIKALYIDCEACVYKDYFDDNAGVLGYWKQITFSTYQQIEPDVFECSCCGSSINNRKHNYCPNCGAKMLKEGDENG